MNTHATNLLTQLIDGLYNAKPTPDLHAFQMLAAELKGAMQADTPPFYQPEYVDKPSEPTPDADGWVENTGVMPECNIKAIKYRDGDVVATTSKLGARWLVINSEGDITHYKPA